MPNQISNLGEVLAEMHQGEAEEQHEPKKMPATTTRTPILASKKTKTKIAGAGEGLRRGCKRFALSSICGFNYNKVKLLDVY